MGAETETTVSPLDLVLFGARGDLARRKLFPALFALHAEQAMPADWRLFGISRSELSPDEFLQPLRDQIEALPSLARLLEDHWSSFCEHLHYVSLDVTQSQDLARLSSCLRGHAQRTFYLATHADLYEGIVEGLATNKLINEQARVVLEKPIGLDLSSARAVSQTVLRHFNEQQVYRIDHYLGKETVQNLLVLRFANTMFENQWNHRYIDHIQITIAETGSVAGRGEFYDRSGALRDMVQNHLLQLLCMTAMEPPHRLDADAVRDEKVKVLRALRPMTPTTIPEKVVRGQYGGADDTASYSEDIGAEAGSDTETYVAMKVEVDNWRWAGVPFYLRTGKRLAERACEIAVHFDSVPHSIFSMQHKSMMANRLVFRLQPDEGIRLSLCRKRAGSTMSVSASELSLTAEDRMPERIPEAYERLLSDVIAGNQTLFVRDDELMAAWEWLDPVIRYWEEGGQIPESYAAGSWVPPAATLMLARDGRLWDELVGQEKGGKRASSH